MNFSRYVTQTRTNRRNLIKFAFGGIGAGLIVSCGFRDDSGDNLDPTATPVIEIDRVEGYSDPDRYKDVTLIVATTEGDYQDAQEVAIFEPFERLTGATIEVEQINLDSLRNQVETAEVEWSLCNLATEEIFPLANSGTLDEIDYAIVDTSNIYHPAIMEHGIGSSVYSTLLSYSDVEPGAIARPQNWEDFWNTTDWPGFRGLRNSPETTLEFALLAAGVPMDQLYPLDVDLGFRKLDEIRESIILWWEQGAQPAQMLASQDLQMSSIWNNRIEKISSADNPVLIQWNQGALSGESWAVPNGAPEREAAMDLINFAIRPETSAAFSLLFPFGPVNSLAFNLIPDEIARTLPTYRDHLEVQFSIDYDWWFIHRQSVQLRFDEWLEVEE